MDGDLGPVETVAAGDGGWGHVLLLCDHASNRVPPEIGDLGLPAEDMARHIAWDVGARDVTLALARRTGAAAVLSTVSRLVIDPNRGEDDPTLLMQLYDGSVIPGNRGAGEAERARRIAAYHRPYHDEVGRAADGIARRGHVPVLVSIHSFTPQLRGRPPRPWQVGVLWDRDRRLAGPLIDALMAEGDLCVGDNEPYSGALAGDTMNRHGTRAGRPHALIEVRNDLISPPDGAEVWAARLHRALDRAMAGMPRADAA